MTRLPKLAPDAAGVQDLLEGLRSWTRCGADPESLRAAARSLAREVDLGGVRKEAELEGLRQGLRLYARKGAWSGEEWRGWVDAVGQAGEGGRVVGPFLGDPQVGEWPWDDPYRLSDEEVIRWLPLVNLAAPSEATRRIVRVFFRHRNRRLWIPAAKALAGDCRDGDGPSLRYFEGCWVRIFPGGFTGSFAEPARAAGRGGPSIHDARHLVFATARFLGLGGAADWVPRDFPEVLLRRELPKDPANASVVILALGEIAKAPARPAEWRERFLERLVGLPADPLCDRALRDLADELPSGQEFSPVHRAIEERLAQPAWESAGGGLRVDGLREWLDSAGWLLDRGRGDLVGAMREAGGGAGELVSLYAGEGQWKAEEAPVDRLVRLLAVILDRDRFLTTEPNRASEAILECFLLLENPQVRDLPWDSIVARAVGSKAPRAIAGPAALAGVAQLLSELAELSEAGEQRSREAGARWIPRMAVREAALPRNVVVALAGSHNGFVQTQAALQLERLLREGGGSAPGASDRLAPQQVRLLWEVLATKPGEKLFPELAKVIRSEEGDSRPIVALVHGFDALREALARAEGSASRESREQVAATFAGLMDVVSAHCLAPPPVEGLRRLLEEAGAAADRQRTLLGIASDCDRIDMLLGEAPGTGEAPAPRPGLEETLRWLSPSVEGVAAGWLELGRELRRCAGGIRDLARQELATAGRLLRVFEERVGGLGPAEQALLWPARVVAAGSLAELERQVGNGELVRTEFHRLVSDCDEAGLAERVRDAGWVGWLGQAQLRRANAFFLERLRFEDARALRRMVREMADPGGATLSLVGAIGYLMPMIAGVASGIFLVLDVGTAWNGLLVGRIGAAMATAGLALVLSFALLASQLLKRVGKLGRSRPGRAIAVARRVLPVFAGAWGLALAIAMLVLGSLEGAEVRSVDGTVVPLLPQVVLWSSLSLFFGLFLGLVMQRQEFSRSDGGP